MSGGDQRSDRPTDVRYRLPRAVEHHVRLSLSTLPPLVAPSPPCCLCVRARARACLSLATSPRAKRFVWDSEYGRYEYDCSDRPVHRHDSHDSWNDCLVPGVPARGHRYSWRSGPAWPPWAGGWTARRSSLVPGLEGDAAVVVLGLLGEGGKHQPFCGPVCLGAQPRRSEAESRAASAQTAGLVQAVRSWLAGDAPYHRRPAGSGGSTTAGHRCHVLDEI